MNYRCQSCKDTRTIQLAFSVVDCLDCPPAESAQNPCTERSRVTSLNFEEFEEFAKLSTTGTQPNELVLHGLEKKVTTFFGLTPHRRFVPPSWNMRQDYDAPPLRWMTAHKIVIDETGKVWKDHGSPSNVGTVVPAYLHTARAALGLEQNPCREYGPNVTYGFNSEKGWSEHTHDRSDPPADGWLRRQHVAVTRSGRIVRDITGTYPIGSNDQPLAALAFASMTLKRKTRAALVQNAKAEFEKQESEDEENEPTECAPAEPAEPVEAKLPVYGWREGAGWTKIMVPKPQLPPAVWMDQHSVVVLNDGWILKHHAMREGQRSPELLKEAIEELDRIPF